MLSFKKWIQKENLAGPGGGPNFEPDSQLALARSNSAHGVGAFPTYDIAPPVSGKRFMNAKDDFGIDYNSILLDIKRRGREISKKRVSEPFRIDLYRGFDANLENLETINGKYVLSPKKSEQGMLWFTHVFIRGYNPIEYVKNRGEWLLTYPLIAKKHYDLITFENGSINKESPKEILNNLETTENSPYMCVGEGCIELPNGWYFTYKNEKFIGTTNKIFVSKEMITKNN